VWSAATTFPLIVAAEMADARTVSMLLEERADPNQPNSAKHTAVQAAARRNKAGSHDEVLSLLRSAANPSAGGA